MKVLLVNASPRKQGNTYTALKEVAAQLEKNGTAEKPEAEPWAAMSFIR